MEEEKSSIQKVIKGNSELKWMLLLARFDANKSAWEKQADLLFGASKKHF